MSAAAITATLPTFTQSATAASQAQQHQQQQAAVVAGITSTPSSTHSSLSTASSAAQQQQQPAQPSSVVAAATSTITHSSTTDMPPPPNSGNNNNSRDIVHIPPILGAAPLGRIPLTNEDELQFKRLQAAYYHMPHPADSERLRLHFPRQPVLTPPHYPQVRVVATAIMCRV